ncbi:hypothetical protein Emtol_3115 [Emticicia oligotrophica DSM 17448]|uniref:Uncharacterized protein n=1 Tax=Emticicia oligotrophica (strain DSM 17448 / CIP 109782 / MTCC 6937 / GPTSA100-15) TaxID=929562 RepID=A0ABM5N469_EMTOG|nr:hypothetical protein Emtol_3115 [Emticicia oligotrophica DSM 17448]
MLSLYAFKGFMDKKIPTQNGWDFMLLTTNCMGYTQ